MKDFDKWNEKKKNINDKADNKFYRKREVWWCTLGVNIGFEQDGTGRDYQRPVLIVRGFSRQVCLIVPLTTSQKINPFRIDVGFIEKKEAFAIISQVRLIDTKRLVNRVAILDEVTFDKINKAIKGLL